MHKKVKNKELKVAFGKALKELRQYRDYNQKECTELVNWSQPKWSMYESGKIGVTLDTVILISDALKFNPLILIFKTLDYFKYKDRALHLSIQEYEEIILKIERLRKDKWKILLKQLEELM